MTQTLDALPTNHSQRILCSYRNPSPNLQIARITNISHWYFERVIFPSDFLLFEAVTGATLEIYSSDGFTTLKSDPIACETLQV